MKRPKRGRRSASFPILFALFLSLTIPAPDVHAADRHAAAEALVAKCIARASRGRAWLEKTLWGLRDQEGGWIGADVANRDGSHDLGPLQVNSWWIPKIAKVTGQPASLVRYWLKNDACFNVDVARWIFLTALSTTRDYWKAVGAYHSPTATKQRMYVSAVALNLQRRFGMRLSKSSGAQPLRKAVLSARIRSWSAYSSGARRPRFQDSNAPVRLAFGLGAILK